MNTTITISLILAASSVIAQPNVNIWDVNPDSICPGDTVYVNFKFTEPSKPDQTVNEFRLNSLSGPLLWSGNWSQLAALPQVPWKGGPQWTYLIKLVTPTLMPAGSATVMSYPYSSAVLSVQAVGIKNCSCTISADFSITTNYHQVTLTAMPTGSVSSATEYYWDMGVGSGFQLGSSVRTYSYVVPNTYSVSLAIKNPTCQDETQKPIVITSKPEEPDTTGIYEYSLDPRKPMYFDLLGNPTELKTGLLIEQRGTRRRKILVQ